MEIGTPVTIEFRTCVSSVRPKVRCRSRGLHFLANRQYLRLHSEPEVSVPPFDLKDFSYMAISALCRLTTKPSESATPDTINADMGELHSARDGQTVPKYWSWMPELEEIPK